MKKNVLALSIAAAIGGLGFAGGAFAVTDTTISTAGSDASNLIVAEAGIGSILLVPYYTAQTEHATLINVVNTDTTNGKAVKVRFRGAANSDDVYDFQVFLSPGDVWAANVSQDAATGLAKLTTADSSCTKPAVVNGTFVTQRLRAAWTDAKKAENTREGYVEIFNMADIPPTRAAIGAEVSVAPTAVNELYTAIKHVKGATPPCTGTAWTYLDTNRSYVQYTSAKTTGVLANPTTGLMGNWTIINVANASSWGAATPAFRTDGTNGVSNLTYFPQVAGDLSASTTVESYTADPLFITTGITPTIATAVLKAQLYDVPDLSTPFVGTSPSLNAAELTRTLATTSVKNEYLTDPAINATTDFVFSTPTRRYAVAVNYEALDGASVNKPVAMYNSVLSNYFASGNTTLSNDQVCLRNIGPTAYDRSEQFTSEPTAVVISPNPLPVAVVFCGEASILTINNPGATRSGVVNGTVAYKNVSTGGWADGWLSIATPGATAGYGLPILGGAFVRATSGASTFGVNWDHRYTRSTVPAGL